MWEFEMTCELVEDSEGSKKTVDKEMCRKNLSFLISFEKIFKEVIFLQNVLKFREMTMLHCWAYKLEILSFIEPARKVPVKPAARLVAKSTSFILKHEQTDR
jgi:hypothetical protein